MSFGSFARITRARDRGFERPLLVGLLAIDLMLVLLNVANFLATGGVKNLIYLGSEANIPTWWSSMKLALASFLFALVAFRTWSIRGAVRGGSVIALILLAMSLDEVASLHERVGSLIDGSTRRASLFHYTGIWFAAVGVPVALSIMFALWKLQGALSAVPGTAFRLSTGFVTLFLGALFVEGMTNFILPPEMFEVRRQVSPYFIAVLVEEGLEMAGYSILLWAGVAFALRHPSMAGLASQYGE